MIRHGYSRGSAGESNRHDHTVEVAARRRDDLHVEVTRVPVAERLADVEAVFKRCRELLAVGKVLPHDVECVILDVRPEAFDLLVFRGPTALPKRVPLHRELLPVRLRRTSGELQVRPGNGRTGQPRLHLDDIAVRQLGTVDAHRQRLERQPLRVRVLADQLGQMDRKRITRQLLSGDDQRIEVGRQSAVNERQVADILEKRSQQLRRDTSGSLAEVFAIAVACGQQELLDAIDRKVLIII